MCGERVKPVNWENIKWINENEAVNVAGEHGQETSSWAFALGGRTYVVENRFIGRCKITEDWPAPHNIPILILLDGVVHEQIHNNCESSYMGDVAKVIALEGWNGVCEDVKANDEVPEEIKQRYRKEQEAVEADGDEAKVRTTGATLDIGTRDHIVYSFDDQLDETITDFLTAEVMADYMKRKVGLDDKNEVHLMWDMFLINAFNRNQYEIDDMQNLFFGLTELIGKGEKSKVFCEAYFSGKLYDKYCPELDEEQTALMSVFLVLGLTHRSIDVLSW